MRERIWATVAEAAIDRDLGLAEAPEGDAFDDVIVNIDGYLCGLKDAQIRGGLHTLGAAPEGEALVDLVLAITRLGHGRVAVAAGLGRRRARARPRRSGARSTRSKRACRELVEAAAAGRVGPPATTPSPP